MMKNVLKYVAIFGTGTGVGFLVAMKLLEKKYAQLAEDEIASVKKHFSNRDRDRTDDEVATPVKEKTEKDISSDGNTYRNSTRKITAYHEMAKEGLTPMIFGGSSVTAPGFVDDEEPEEDIDDGRPLTDEAGFEEGDFVEDAAFTDLTSVDRTMPYVIDARDYSETCTTYDKIFLAYYTLDDVLCDENEDIVDIDETVGWDCFKVLDTQNTCWIRNEAINTDFEVVNVRSSYAETVHGIHLDASMSPREKYNRQRKKGDD